MPLSRGRVSLVVGWLIGELAAALAGAALDANATRAGPDHFVTPAMRADDIHEHVPKRFLDTICVATPIAGDLGFTVIWCVTRDHIENFFFAGAREIRHRTIERLLLHFGKFS